MKISEYRKKYNRGLTSQKKKSPNLSTLRKKKKAMLLWWEKPKNKKKSCESFKNKDLSYMTSSYLNKLSKASKQYIKENGHPMEGKHYSKEVCQKQKEMMLEKWKDSAYRKKMVSGRKENVTPAFRSLMSRIVTKRISEEGICTPTYGFVKKLGHNVASSYEEYTGLFLKNNNIAYVYEKPFTLIYKDSSIHTYFADFTLIKNKVVIEPKGYYRGIETAKIKLKLFKEQYPEYTLYIVGNRNILLKGMPEFSDHIVDLKEIETILPKIKEI